MISELTMGDMWRFALNTGVVTDNADPEGLYRVRIAIPGRIPETTWAEPIGTMGGGAPQAGGMAPVAIGATVAVFFDGGDIESPRYMPAWWGVRPATGSEMPAPARDAGAEAHKVAAFQWGGWTVQIDQRDGLLRIEDADDPDTALTIQRPAQGGRFVIDCDNFVVRARGVVSLEGTSTNIGGRKVIQNGRVIP